MRRNTFTRNKKGFSLIELCIVIGLLAILAGSITPVFIKRVQIKAGEKTALEMSTIQQAALSYFTENAEWPVNLSVLKSAGYLNPFWVTNNPWQNPYTISSNPASFTVSTSVPQEWSALVVRDLPTSSISGSTVVSSVPAPGIAPDKSLPVGSIIMWSGSIASIPEGWQLCDGTNGTPDLRDKFIVAASQDNAGIAVTNIEGSLKQTGGYKEHYHYGSPHTHSFSGTTERNYQESGVRNDYQNISAAVNGHSHNFSGTTTVSGAGQTSTTGNIPPYYALCFIMKIL